MKANTPTFWLLLIIALIVLSACAISPSNISHKTPREDFRVVSMRTEDLAPNIVGLIESRYPFKHFQTTVVQSNGDLTIRSYDEARGYVLWISLIQIDEDTQLRMYLSPDVFWDAEQIAKELREDIEKLDN